MQAENESHRPDSGTSHCSKLRDVVSIVYAEMDSALTRNALQRGHVHRWGKMLRVALEPNDHAPRDCNVYPTSSRVCERGTKGCNVYHHDECDEAEAETNSFCNENDEGDETFDRRKEHRQRVIASCDKYNEIGPLDDGFQYFWIKDRGALSAFDLRAIADELDRRNKDWEEQIERDLSR